MDLEAQLKARRDEVTYTQTELHQTTTQLHEYNAKPKTQVVTKTREVPHTEYREKKVRKVTTETPHAKEVQRITGAVDTRLVQDYERHYQTYSSPVRASTAKSRVVTRHSNPFVGAEATRVVKKSKSPSKYRAINETLYGTGHQSYATSTMLPGSAYSYEEASPTTKIIGSSKNPYVSAGVKRSSISNKGKWNKY